jgi:hypothetical protein
MEGDNLAGSLLLSPRGDDGLDGLPTENLNSVSAGPPLHLRSTFKTHLFLSQIELNLGSQCFSLDSYLGNASPTSPAKKDSVL